MRRFLIPATAQARIFVLGSWTPCQFYLRRAAKIAMKANPTIVAELGSGTTPTLTVYCPKFSSANSATEITGHSSQVAVDHYLTWNEKDIKHILKNFDTFAEDDD